MKIEIKDKPPYKHINPQLCAGKVYQRIDSKQYYFACEAIFDSMSVVTLVNLETGIRWASEGGFGTGRFIDVTENSTLVVEI